MYLILKSELTSLDGVCILYTYDSGVASLKLSMWMIRDGLHEYQPESLIKNGSQTIKNVRYFSAGSDFEQEYVYIAYSKDFFTSDSHNVICVSGSDMLLLKADDIYEVFNEILRIFEYYNSWESSLIEHIDTGATLQRLIDLSKDVFLHPIVLTDASHQPLAMYFPEDYHNSEYDNYRDVNQNIPLDILTIMNAELVQNIHIHTSYLSRNNTFSHPGILRNLFRNDELVGWLVILDLVEENCERLLQLSDTFGKLIEYWFHSQEGNMLTSQSDLFSDILTGKESDRSRIISRLQGIGWLEDDEKIVIQIAVGSINDPTLYTLKRVLPQTFSGCYIVPYLSNLVLVANLRLLNQRSLENLLKDVLCKIQTYCGISYKFMNMLKLNQYYRQAELASIYGKKDPGTLNYCENYAMDYLKDVIQDNLATDIRHPALNILKHYDAVYNTEYHKTLREYLNNERDQRKTAKLMCIHRNTLVYRVNRIEEILGFDLDNTDVRTHILMSYFIGESKGG